MTQDWQNFYLLAGSASATLIGLIFVAISLGARLLPTQADSSVRAFVTPTVLHFGAVVVFSAIALIPVLGPGGLGLISLVIGGLGLVYSANVLRQMRLHHEQQQALDKRHWLWHLVLPLSGYLLIFAAGVGLLLGPAGWVAALAPAMVVLLIVGLRNAFDLIMWIARQPG